MDLASMSWMAPAAGCLVLLYIFHQIIWQLLKSPAVRSRRSRPAIEELEPRCLLATWVAIGPAPQVDTAGVPKQQDNVSGRVSALAYTTDTSADHASDPGHRATPALFAGSASGGLWMITDVTGATPTWVPVLDTGMTNLAGAPMDPAANPGAIDIGAITVDPSHPNIIYAGTGEANFTADNRYGCGILARTMVATTGIFYGRTRDATLSPRSLP